jgi:carbonic anhydrase
MEKILSGVIRFHEKMAEEMRPAFFRLVREGQHPRALFITCADSRIVPDLLTSTDPGDLFLIRNIGNLVPPYAAVLDGSADTSIAAAVEYSLNVLGVKNIIVCGHSDCGAMKAALNRHALPEGTPLWRWLQHAEITVAHQDEIAMLHDAEQPHDRLAQINVLQQLNNLREYPDVQTRLEAGELHLYGWFLSIENAEVRMFHPGRNRFVRVDPQSVEEIRFLRQVFNGVAPAETTLAAR